MKNRDSILLEEAYQNIVKEMAYNPKEGGRQLTGSYRPLMPKYSQMPSVEKISKSAKSEEELEERKVAASASIQENIKKLESDPNDIAAARDVLNILNNFIEEKEIRTGVKEKTPREEFLIGTEEMSYKEILEKILKLTTSGSNDPALIIPKKDPETFEVTPGLTVDQYLFTFDDESKKKVPIEGRTADHYYLYREILKALPDLEGQIRSRREKTYEGTKGVELYYFVIKYKVILNGKHVGTAEHTGTTSGKLLFYPNNLGIQEGLKSMDPKEFKSFLNNENVDISEKEFVPYRSTTFIPEGGVFRETKSGKNPLFWDTNKRRPRFKGEPELVPPPFPYNKYKPAEVLGKTLEEVRFAVGHYEAEEEFKKLYPKGEYPFLYSGGRFSGKVDSEEKKENE